MAGNLSPPFFEGILTQRDPVFVRSSGSWLSWDGAVSSQNLPQAPTIVVGDLILAFFYFSEGVSVSPVGGDGGWASMRRWADRAELWARRATGDSNDQYVIPAISSSGQAGGLANMCSIGGIQDFWADGNNAVENAFDEIDGAVDYIALSGIGVGSPEVDDTLVVSYIGKQWQLPSYEPSSYTVTYPATPEIVEIDRQTPSVEWEDGRVAIALWGILWQETPESFSDVFGMQDPTDPGTVGALTTLTSRLREDTP